jgi:hypothetical protein
MLGFLLISILFQDFDEVYYHPETVLQKADAYATAYKSSIHNDLVGLYHCPTSRGYPKIR